MSNFCLENRNFFKCLKKSNFFKNLPEKIDFFIFAWQNRNFSEICLEKPKLFKDLPGNIENLLKICLEISKFFKNLPGKIEFFGIFHGRIDFCVKLTEKNEIF